MRSSGKSKPRKSSAGRSPSRNSKTEFISHFPRSKISLAWFLALAGIYSAAVYFFMGEKGLPVYDTAMFSAMAAINFITLWYSFRIRSQKARRQVFWGSFVLIAGFIVYNSLLLEVAKGNFGLVSVLGFAVDITMTAGYLLLLFGMKGVVKP